MSVGEEVFIFEGLITDLQLYVADFFTIEVFYTIIRVHRAYYKLLVENKSFYYPFKIRHANTLFRTIPGQIYLIDKYMDVELLLYIYEHTKLSKRKYLISCEFSAIIKNIVILLLKEDGIQPPIYFDNKSVKIMPRLKYIFRDDLEVYKANIVKDKRVHHEDLDLAIQLNREKIIEYLLLSNLPVGTTRNPVYEKLEITHETQKLLCKDRLSPITKKIFKIRKEDIIKYANSWNSLSVVQRDISYQGVLLLHEIGVRLNSSVVEGIDANNLPHLLIPFLILSTLR